jgi:hypothetical protein
LRPTNIHTVDRSAFDTTSPDFLALIGSAYSVGSLREAAEPILPRVMTTWTASKKGLSSAPQDLATRLGINDAFRKRLAAELPNYKIPPQPETYFCSQLVAHLLKKSNLLPSTQDTPYLTPTGLHALLLRFGWKDVSASDYNSDKIKAVAFQSPARCATRYYERLAQIKLGTQILGAGEHAKMIGAILAKATSRLDEVLKRLPPAPDK